MKKKFNVKNVFLKLTSRTITYGNEHKISHMLPKNVEEDVFGNWFYRIGESRTMFTAHMDDASWDSGKKVNHRYDGDFITSDGTTILGADDKAGVTILLYMIDKGIPGTYYFFIGEESGMQGSKGILCSKKQWFIDNFDRCISFDRRGYGSIISRQIGKQGCSVEFVNALKEQYDSLGMIHRNDPGGIFTDSATFFGVIPECTNLSVGYFHEHSTMEKQNIVYLEKLADASTKIKWEELPTIGVKQIKFGAFDRKNQHDNYDYYDDYYDGWY